MALSAVDPYLQELQDRLTFYFNGPSRDGGALASGLRWTLAAGAPDRPVSEMPGESLTDLLLPALRGEVQAALNAQGQLEIKGLAAYLAAPLQHRPSSLSGADGGRTCILVHYADRSTAAIAARQAAEQQQRAAETRDTTLRALLHDHSGFIHARLAHFVGREVELAAIRTRIAETQPHGGYVTITGQAGQGKSCVIAHLVKDAGIDTSIYHFIPFSPGPDHQVGTRRRLSRLTNGGHYNGT
jgi:hypothetical protein